jgi:hypothetical protein
LGDPTCLREPWCSHQDAHGLLSSTVNVISKKR